MGSNMNTRNNYPDDMNLENDLLENDILDEEDEFDLEQRFIPNLRKEAKRQKAATESKKNKWRIKE